MNLTDSRSKSSFVPLQCLFESCYADISHREQHCWSLRTNSLPWKDQWKEKASFCLLVLLQICAGQQNELQHQLLRTKHLHTFAPVLPLPGRTRDQSPALSTGILMALKLWRSHKLPAQTPLRTHTSRTLRTPRHMQHRRSEHPTKTAQARSHLQAATFPPDLQNPTTNNAAAISLPKPVPATLFLKRSKPITQEQGYLVIFSLPPQSSLRLHSSILVLNSQTSPTQNQQRQDHPSSPEMEAAFKTVTSIRLVCLSKNNFSWTKSDLNHSSLLLQL